MLQKIKCKLRFHDFRCFIFKKHYLRYCTNCPALESFRSDDKWYTVSPFFVFYNDIMDQFKIARMLGRTIGYKISWKDRNKRPAELPKLDIQTIKEELKQSRDPYSDLEVVDEDTKSS